MQNSPVTQRVLVKTVDFLLHLKLKDYLLILILFFSATQLGYHLWPLSSLVYGVRIDYLAPTLYLFDLLLLSYLITRRPVLKRNSRLQIEKGSAAAERTGLIGTLLPILLTNLLYSQNPLSTLSWSLHFILYYLFLVALWSDLKGSVQPADSKAGRSDPKGVISLVLTLSLLFQTLLATSQVFLGHSVGGLLYYLGERSVAVGSPNIALATFMDHVVLRAYGTFSHPNILAGFSVISLLITIQVWRQRQSSVGLTLKDSSAMSTRKDPRRSGPMGTKMIWITAILTILLVLLTQSRAAALALFGLVIPLYLIRTLKMRLLYYFITLLLTYSLSPTLISPPRSELSVSQRLDLQGLSLKVIQANPTFGTGAQASISTYPAVSPTTRLLQPDHNTFTLFLSWFGTFGVLVIIYYFRICLEFRISNLGFFVPLLPLLLLDHYLLTSPQGLFILLLYFNVVNYSHA